MDSAIHSFLPLGRKVEAQDAGDLAAALRDALTPVPEETMKMLEIMLVPSNCKAIGNVNNNNNNHNNSDVYAHIIINNITNSLTITTLMSIFIILVLVRLMSIFITAVVSDG